jgi:hypothetical protein
MLDSLSAKAQQEAAGGLSRKRDAEMIKHRGSKPTGECQNRSAFSLSLLSTGAKHELRNFAILPALEKQEKKQA